MILHRIIKQIYVDILKLAVQILITVYSYYLDKGTRWSDTHNFLVFNIMYIIVVFYIIQKYRY